MDAEVKTLQGLKQILEIFLQENFPTLNNVYFEKLITHLSKPENIYILQDSYSVEWLNSCVAQLENDYKSVNSKVISFTLNFCSLMLRNEWILISIRDKRITDRLLNIIELHRDELTPSMKLGYIRILTSISCISFGLAYIRLQKAWRYLIELCKCDHTLYVVREARHLVYELLYKFSVKAKDNNLVLEMLSEIIKPIHENIYKVETDRILINVDDSEIQHKISSILDLLNYIFQQTLNAEEKTNIVHLCESHHNLNLTIWKLVEMTQNSGFLGKILQTLTSWNFAMLVYDHWEKDSIDPEKFHQFGLNFFNALKFCITRHEFVNFIKLAELNHVLWKKLGKRAPSEIMIENQSVRFENQLITFHLLPLLFILRKNIHFEELFDNYVMKMFEISCEHTLRICYAFRDAAFASATPTALTMIADLAYKSIHGILSMKNILEREQAVLVFQAMIYALKIFVETSPKGDCLQHTEGNCKVWQGIEFITVIPQVLYAVLIGLQSLIQRYHINWKESIESICLVNGLIPVLENPHITDKLTIQALKLVQLSIEHFLSPNMALLVDNLDGSGLVSLGPIIVKRLHDPTWEVRDSALELTISIADISQCKFPAFQQFLHEYNICEIVLCMVKSDSESYVRASALKCLIKMVPINIIWENNLNNNELIDHLFYLIYNESEGLVRKEAVGTLRAIYEHRKIASNYSNALYSTLAHCVLIDLHWEVKVEALYFWELELEKQFTNQGMIDDTFPTVTFSKEDKKIVTLTKKEINLRIIKVFNELSRKGCLGILLKCIQEEYDSEVLNVTVGIINRLLEKLMKYDYETITEDTVSNTELMPTQIHGGVSNSCNHVAANNDLIINEDEIARNNQIMKKQSDEVIESILNSQDINLLAASYAKQLHVNNGIMENDLPNEINMELYKDYTHIGSKYFIESIKQLDLQNIRRNQQDWLLCNENLISLIDDIIVSIKHQNETLFADCY